MGSADVRVARSVLYTVDLAVVVDEHAIEE